ncbi:hypothetical protein ACKI1I_38205 [Streptomyces turgidiscabies]|uniref:Uncharacterized protein n=1 Tax=Streptomyces turgidiscabies (strain Car8) TaxID=698760 RepID=L7F7P1_STRT8|nr:MULTISPECIES: hypothetical protein [Streptomyces]ELP67593.1 hypothetical protein STRTUCAR8_05880 [Streptomyces turgidiscabies Car8]MDX3499424.1 hypothetical protein [Streptomyces turgidiscabies]GAQ76897.1 hypothetical protein T45_08708 [Streptomyces turgidiscabies]
MGYGSFGFLPLALVLSALAIAWVVVGVHALLLGRMPGEWLPRRVRQPRIWGAGALLMVVSGQAGSPSFLAVGVGLVALGHVVNSRR